jgi:SAM-dependent methyltransferase
MFTVFQRLRKVLASKGGRRHLINTWRWSFGQAWRAATGVQISEVLDELRLVSLKLPEREFGFQSTINPQEFLDLARKHRAGKQSGHEEVYGCLDFDRSKIGAVLEIGIGSNDPKMPSSMGRNGVPGASLLLWRELFPNAQVIGADFDKKILMNAERISSFFVDSTNSKSIEDMLGAISQTLEVNDFDLIIDDGLHTPEANLRNFRVLNESLRPGGFYVIEDIDASWAPMFDLFGRGLDDFDSKLVFGDAQKNHGFLILRKRH